ncbi:SDR family NAD(P)-dependent oxidoreductase [Parahaliea aestuarii]|uniref:SDR family oxidoreductase n=1 Tax=Parahaliea aestuarii TaxID=1852021 RepID=A0A5C8ZW60_9GAMM|nr:SDR family NAD(P)-dependent oxidoreductase [Parahaliea aestuarii]TXS91800.1 SDR family oxidoreductase [Parahaliea aestuarii]
MYDFGGQVVLVTGAASGIGRATAERFHSEGASVVLADRNLEGVQSVAQELGGDRTHCLEFDAIDRDSCIGMVRSAVEHFGKLDVLCNIAGIAGGWRLEDMPPEDWHRMIDINLNSLFHITQAAIPALVESRGNVVNMSSASGKQGQPYGTCYCASKAGVIGFSKAVAAEFASRGVRSNAICPGGVKTPIYDNYTFPDNAEMDLIDRMRSLPGFGEAEVSDITAMILFLASDEARFITGVAFEVDGGQLNL